MSELRITDIKFRPVKRKNEYENEISAMADIVLNDEITLTDLPIFESSDGRSLSVDAPFTEYDRLSFRFKSQELDRKMRHEILDAYVAYKNGVKESRKTCGRMLKEDKGNVIKDVSVEILDMDLDDPDKDFEVIDDFDIGGEYDNVEDVMVKAAGRVMACNKNSIYYCEIAALDGASGQEIPLKNVMDKPGSYEVDIFRRHSGNREYRINIFFDVE